jgi:hypothetical protein
LQTAVQNVSSNSSQPGHVWIQNGDYEGSSLTIQKDVDIRSYGGRADVNGRLLLNSHPDRDTLDSVAQISVRNGGVLVIE